MAQSSTTSEADYALDVVKILGITGKEKKVMTIAINVPSKRFGVKDIVKIEGKALNSQEVNRIALVAPHASINIIHNYTVVEKLEVKLPKAIEGIIKCVNPCCISNSDEPVVSKFYVKDRGTLNVKVPLLRRNFRASRCSRATLRQPFLSQQKQFFKIFHSQ